MVEKDKETMQEIRKICGENQVILEEINSRLTPSSIKKQARFENIKEFNKEGKEYFFIEYNAKNVTQTHKFLKNYFDNKFIRTDFLSDLRLICIFNKTIIYFVLERIPSSDFLCGDYSVENLQEITSRIKLCLNIVMCCMKVREQLLEKVKDPKLVTLYGLSTEKFLYSSETKRVQFTNIGIDELTMAESDPNDKRFWSPQKFLTVFKNLDKYKHDIYALGCVIYEIISGCPPLVENSEAAFEVIKTKKAPLISYECQEKIEEQLKEFQKKNQLIDLISRMTELEESNRTITFEEVYQTLFSFLPENINRIKCNNCLEVAQVILKSNNGRYCENCRALFASREDSDFYQDNVDNIQETISDRIVDMKYQLRKNLESIIDSNKFNDHIEQINTYQQDFEGFITDTSAINQRIDETIEMLKKQKALINEHYNNYYNSNKQFSQRSLSIYTELKNIVETSFNKKNGEFLEIQGNTDKYQHDFDLLVKDIQRLQTSSNETKKLHNVCQTFSASFENKFDELFRKNKRTFRANLDEGFLLLDSIDDKINNLNTISQTQEIKNLNGLNAIEHILEERLKKNNNEQECIKISQDSDFSDFIYVNDLGDDEGDTQYCKNNDN